MTNIRIRGNVYGYLKNTLYLEWLWGGGRRGGSIPTNRCHLIKLWTETKRKSSQNLARISLRSELCPYGAAEVAVDFQNFYPSSHPNTNNVFLLFIFHCLTALPFVYYHLTLLHNYHNILFYTILTCTHNVSVCIQPSPFSTNKHS